MLKRAKPEKRSYRSLIKKKGVTSFEVIAGESDLWISLPKSKVSNLKLLKKRLTDYLISIRTQLLSYGKKHLEFLGSLKPVSTDILSPLIVKEMADASKTVGVGPMAGVAGGVNKFMGKKLMELGFPHFTIENGGDVFVSSNKPLTSAIIVGNPELDGKVGIEVPEGKWGLCSSSSKIGHSLSFGNTQISTALAVNPIVADCAATLLGNSRTEGEFIEKCKSLNELEGALGLINGKFIIFGNLKLVKLA